MENLLDEVPNNHRSVRVPHPSWSSSSSPPTWQVRFPICQALVTFLFLSLFLVIQTRFFLSNEICLPFVFHWMSVRRLVLQRSIPCFSGRTLKPGEKVICLLPGNCLSSYWILIHHGTPLKRAEIHLKLYLWVSLSTMLEENGSWQLFKFTQPACLCWL